MVFSTGEIQKLWNSEKEFYRTHEVGTGTQSFVKKVFESSDYFGLREGKLSTSEEKRKNEFIYEKNAKENRRADFVLYISSEVIIPCEVECFDNIRAGEKQLLDYQNDFERQYGLLTDGFTWRFYNNNIYKSFTLNELISQKELFLDFWHEYIKPEHYYLSFFETAGQLALLDKTPLFVGENRELFFEDITKLIHSFINKLKLEGYLEGLDAKNKSKKAVEITYAYIIQFILYKTLVDNCFGDYEIEFNRGVDKIHEYLAQNRFKDVLSIIDNVSRTISENIYRPFSKEQELTYIRT